MDVGVFEADSGHAEGGAGEPEAFVVKVWRVVRFDNLLWGIGVMLTVHYDVEALVFFSEAVGHGHFDIVEFDISRP